LEAADMHSVHSKYGIPFFYTLHSHVNFSFQVTKVLSVTNYLKTDSKAMVTRVLDTLTENAVNHSKIVATEIIDDILKGAVKTDNNSTKRKHSVTDKTPWLLNLSLNN
jgi:pseudouridine-5'-phosphate glycosidase